MFSERPGRRQNTKPPPHCSPMLPHCGRGKAWPCRKQGLGTLAHTPHCGRQLVLAISLEEDMRKEAGPATNAVAGSDAKQAWRATTHFAWQTTTLFFPPAHGIAPTSTKTQCGQRERSTPEARNAHLKCISRSSLSSAVASSIAMSQELRTCDPTHKPKLGRRNRLWCEQEGAVRGDRHSRHVDHRRLYG